MLKAILFHMGGNNHQLSLKTADVIDKIIQNSCGSIINKVNTQKVNERVQSQTR